MRIERVGDFVHKYLRDVVDPNQARLRVLESRLWPELNPLTYHPGLHRLTGPFVEGVTPAEAPLALRRRLGGVGVFDVKRTNIVQTPTGPVLIDFVVHASLGYVLRYHPDPSARLLDLMELTAGHDPGRWRLHPSPEAAAAAAIAAALELYRTNIGDEAAP